MNQVFSYALKTFLATLISTMSEPLRNMAIEGAYKFYEFAQTTENDYDNILADLLFGILGLDAPE